MIIEQAKEILKIEAEAILSLQEKIDQNFIKALDLIYSCEGKVIVIGMGKSGLIGKKIASTFASTGTPALFLHPAEGIHGDLGVITRKDLVVAISNSGETNEISQILPLVKSLGIKLVVLIGNRNSTLARSGDAVIDIGVEQEACPFGLVPTASTTAALAMGDALAISLLRRRGFKKEDFALLHPGGILGRKLLLKVEDLMHGKESIPLVEEDTLMKEALLEMTSKRLGVTGVCNQKGNLVGVITDGDLRRALEKSEDLLNKKASEVMTRSPKTIEPTALAVGALEKMEKYAITSLFILEKKRRKPIGIIHMHDLVKAGLT